MTAALRRRSAEFAARGTPTACRPAPHRSQAHRAPRAGRHRVGLPQSVQRGRPPAPPWFTAPPARRAPLSLSCSASSARRTWRRRRPPPVPKAASTRTESGWPVPEPAAETVADPLGDGGGDSPPPPRGADGLGVTPGHRRRPTARRDGLGRPLGFTVTGGNANDCTRFTAVMQADSRARIGPSGPTRSATLSAADATADNPWPSTTRFTGA